VDGEGGEVGVDGLYLVGEQGALGGKGDVDIVAGGNLYESGWTQGLDAIVPWEVQFLFVFAVNGKTFLQRGMFHHAMNNGFLEKVVSKTFYLGWRQGRFRNRVTSLRQIGLLG
jgi:hypothetical protein